MALEIVSPGSEAEGFDLPVKLGEQEGLRFTEEEEFLNASAVVLGEVLAEFPIEGLGLLKCGKLLIGNEKPIIALKKIRDDQNLITCRQQLARFKSFTSVNGYSGTGRQLGTCQLSLFAVRPQLVCEFSEIK